MRKPIHILLVGAVSLLALVGILHAQMDDIQEFEGFSVPEFNEKGEMVSQLFGDYAKVLPGGVIEITNLKIEFYKLEQVVMTVTAPACTYNQDLGTASSKSDVRIEREQLIVTGTGFSWDVKDQNVHIFKNARVELADIRHRDMITPPLGDTP